MEKTLFSLKRLMLILFFLIASSLLNQRLSAIAPPEMELNTGQVKQGGLLIVQINLADLPFIAEQLTISFNDRHYPLRRNESGQYQTMIGISYWLKPGNQHLSLIQGEKIINTAQFEIIAGNFKNSYLYVEASLEKIIRPRDPQTEKRKKHESALIKKARSKSVPEKLWEDNFSWPLAGKITTGFGATRYVNDQLQSRHSGIDIAAPTGTEITASNHGVVVLAADLLVTGKTIIIDHGYEVFSSYSHLNSLNVAVGDKIQKGQIIGRCGSTGFSTGPHLHWTITVGGVYVNPTDLISSF